MVFIDRKIKMETISVIILPENQAQIVATAVHNTFGHSAITRLTQECYRLFKIPNIDNVIRELVSKCEDCTLLRQDPKITKDMKKFEIPQSIGEIAYCDEITRTRPNGLDKNTGIPYT